MAFLCICGILAGGLGVITLVMSQTVFGEIMGILIAGFGAIYIGMAAVLDSVQRAMTALLKRTESIQTTSSSVDLRLNQISIDTLKLAKFLDRYDPPADPQS
jgi:hypothetical protein